MTLMICRRRAAGVSGSDRCLAIRKAGSRTGSALVNKEGSNAAGALDRFFMVVDPRTRGLMSFSSWEAAMSCDDQLLPRRGSIGTQQLSIVLVFNNYYSPIRHE